MSHHIPNSYHCLTYLFPLPQIPHIHHSSPCHRAKEHYELALDIFALHMGPRSAMVTDLEHRINELRGYLEM